MGVFYGIILQEKQGSLQVSYLTAPWRDDPFYQKKRIAPDGSISIGEVLKMARIQPGDLVEIIPATNKITIKPVTPQKVKGVVRAVAGKWKDRRDLVEDLSRLREDEDDRPGTSRE